MTPSSGTLKMWDTRAPDKAVSNVTCPVPALSLDWCIARPTTCAAGFTDGSLMVFDVRTSVW